MNVNCKPFCGFEPTYKELKQKHIFLCICPILHVLSLPIRNWNQNKALLAYRPIEGFEPTYEELKLTFGAYGSGNRPKFWAYL